MKFINFWPVVSFLVASVEANDAQYKQSGTEVDRSKQITKPTRQHGNAIVKRFTDSDEISFLISGDDDARVVVASDLEDLDFSIAMPGDEETRSYERIDDLVGEGSLLAKNRETIEGVKVDARAMRLKIGRGGELRVRADVGRTTSGNRPGRRPGPGRGGHGGRAGGDRGGPGGGRVRRPGSRSLAESKTVAILNPGSLLNLCYETTSLINYVGEPLTLKVALCETDSDVVRSGDDGVRAGTFAVSNPDSGRDGSVVELPPTDDDGWSRVTFVPDSAGVHSISIDALVRADGEEFERQARGGIAVSERRLLDVESASLGAKGGEGDDAAVQLTVSFDLEEGKKGLGSSCDFELAEGRKGLCSFRVSADVVDGKGRGVVTASALADLEDVGGGVGTLSVVIQPEWFRGSDPSSFSIEYLRVSSREGSVPLFIAENIPLGVAAGITPDYFDRRRRLSETSEERDRRMSQGVRPPRPAGGVRRELQSNKIIASHGYCSSDVWGDDLPGTEKFEDYGQNRSHDQFAQRLKDFGDSLGGGCSIIAHSQGGAAALHLFANYWSCLDDAPDSGRLIQTVGTPWQGTRLAGTAADLGNVFGFGCGKNPDLTYEGAENWLATIPYSLQGRVTYYTTSFKTRWWAYDFCNLVTDVLLGDPEDGTTEKAKGQLPGGRNGGHKKGFCHTGGMRDPAQTSDRSRNREMLSKAAV